MATVNILDAFGYEWAQDGSVDPIDELQWRAGWAYIGATPPSVEQFNKAFQIFDQKGNWLYGNMAEVFAAAGVTPTSGDLLALLDSLRGTGLFQTAAPGTSDTAAATHAFVQAGLTASPGRLLNVRFLTTSGTYVPTAGTGSINVIGVGGGGAGGGSGTTGPNIVSAAAGGAGGGWFRKRILAGFESVPYTIGAGGITGVGGAGGPGGNTSFGAFATANGGNGGGFGTQTANTNVAIGGQAGAGGATGGDVNGFGGSGQYAIFGPAFQISGQGGFSLMGSGATWVVTAGNGIAASSYGSGGSGSVSGPSYGANRGGGVGADGIIIVEEYA